MISKSGLIFILLFFVGCVSALFSSPYVGVLLYELIYFLNPPARWWHGDLPVLRYSFIVVVVTYCGVFFSRKSDYTRSSSVFSVPQTKYLTLLLLFVFVSSFWAVDPEVHSVLQLKLVKIVIFVYLLYRLIDTPEKFERLLGVYLLGVFYISWVGWQVGRTGAGRLEGIGGADTVKVNGTAAVVATAIPLFVFYVLFGKTRVVKVASFCGLTFALNCLVLLNSRGAFLALVVSGAYFLFHVFKMSGIAQIKAKVAAGIAVFFSLFLYLADSVFWLRMGTLENVDPESGSGRRVLFWLKSFDVLGDYPLGVGGGGYERLSPQYLPAEWLTGGTRAVHSVWFEVLSEFGYHGLVVFLFFVLSNFLLLRKAGLYLKSEGNTYCYFQSVAIGSSFVGLLVSSSFIDFFFGELMYWIPAHIAAFYSIYCLKQSEDGDGQ